jgi:hypothetical protein
MKALNRDTPMSQSDNDFIDILETTFANSSTFSIRYEKGRFRDKIAKGMLQGEFLKEGFDGRDLRYGIELGALAETWYRHPVTGARLKAVVCLSLQERQLTFTKRLLNYEIVSKKAVSRVLWALIFGGITGLWINQSLAFSKRAVPLPTPVIHEMPEGIRKFIDREQKVVCYWIRSVSLSCVKLGGCD